MEIILIIILVLINVFTLYALNVALNKIELYKQNKDDVEKFILAIQDKVLDWVNELDRIDKRGSFESDDEVGIFFKGLKTLLSQIRNFIFSEAVYGDNDKENTDNKE